MTHAVMSLHEPLSTSLGITWIEHQGYSYNIFPIQNPMSMINTSLRCDMHGSSRETFAELHLLVRGPTRALSRYFGGSFLVVGDMNVIQDP